MVERTEVEKYVRQMVASDILYRELKRLGEKGMRLLNKSAGELSDLLENKTKVGARVIARLEELEEEKEARVLNEGISSFCKKYSRHGKILRGLIEEKRIQKNKYLSYGIKPSFKLGEEDYIQAIMSLNFNKRDAASIYSHILSSSEKEKRADEYKERKILLNKKTMKKK